LGFRELTFWDSYGRYLVTGLAVISGQAALIAGLLMHRTRRRRAEAALRGQDAALQASHKEIETLAGRLIASQEAERARIGRELHDDVCQKLALLSIDIAQLGRTSPAKDDGDSVKIRQIAALTAQIADDVQNLSRQLHPGRLEFLGLVPTIRLLCRDMSIQHNPTVIEFKEKHVPRDLAPEVALCLYRVVQEALHNIVKHSGALHALVRLVYADRTLKLLVADSGCGFQSGERDGIGLLTMRERVHFLDGQIEITSTPGSGTQITVQVPVTPVRSAAEAIRVAGSASH
jgi:signal transduction histidine kinase